MNKIKEQIIELISGYMDKTLWVWCIVLFEKHIKWIESPYKPKYITIWSESWLPNWRTIAVIGHYDITAVLKYINKTKKYLMDNVSIFQWEILIEPIYWQYYLHILNKPLNLYTEEENKNLLELLLKLKNETK